MPERKSRDEILAEIELLVEKVIAPIREAGDDDTADFYREELFAYRIAQMNALLYLNSCFSFPQVLYPGSGSDTVSHMVFGRNIIHTSLETYSGGDKQYFQDMPGAQRVVSDNEMLPFGDGAFNCVLALDTGISYLTQWNHELVRVLAPRGIMLVSNNSFTSDDEARGLLFSTREDMRLSYTNVVPGDTEKPIEFFGYEKMSR